MATAKTGVIKAAVLSPQPVAGFLSAPVERWSLIYQPGRGVQIHLGELAWKWYFRSGPRPPVLLVTTWCSLRSWCEGSNWWSWGRVFAPQASENCMWWFKGDFLRVPLKVHLQQWTTADKHHTLQLGLGFGRAFFSRRVSQHCVELPREAVNACGL